MFARAPLLLPFIGVASALFCKWPGETTRLSGSMTDDEYGHYLNYLKSLSEMPALAEAYCASHPDHHFYDIFSLTYQCPLPVKRYPEGTADGGKWTCNLENMAPGSLVYSIGSEGDYAFETEMQNFGFEVHTFDCTGDYGSNAPQGVRFHKWCADGHDHAPFYKLKTLMDRLGHHRIDLLKMDIEGSEFATLPMLAELPAHRRPKQIAVEIHAFGTGHRWAGKRSVPTLKKTLALMLQMHELGYRLVTREDNYLAPCCSEFLYVLQK